MSKTKSQLLMASNYLFKKISEISKPICISMYGKDNYYCIRTYTILTADIFKALFKMNKKYPSVCVQYDRNVFQLFTEEKVTSISKKQEYKTLFQKLNEE